MTRRTLGVIGAAGLGLLLAVATATRADGPVEQTANGATLKLKKGAFEPNESIAIEFTAPATLHAYAWLGLIPSSAPHGKASVNDSHDVKYEYLNSRTSGTITFPAPAKPGSYDIRMSNHAGADDREIVSVTFTVGSTGEDLKPTLTLAKTDLGSHEEFKVTFTASYTYERPWVGLIPSDVPHGSGAENDKHDVAYWYLDGKVKGELTFRAPGRPGSYDLRLNESSAGKEVASVTFKVSASPDDASIEPSLNATKKTLLSHQMVEGLFNAPIVYDYNAWIAVVPSSVQHGTSAENDKHDLGYDTLRGRTGGTFSLRVPGKPGSYDLRLHDGQRADSKEVASITITVKMPEGGEREPTVKLDKETVKPGQEVTATFTAPAWFDYNAWLGVVPSEIAHGTTSTNDSHDVTYDYLRGRMQDTWAFKAPTKPGSYDVRLNNAAGGSGDNKEYATATFTVKE